MDGTAQQDTIFGDQRDPFGLGIYGMADRIKRRFRLKLRQNQPNVENANRDVSNHDRGDGQEHPVHANSSMAMMSNPGISAIRVVDALIARNTNQNRRKARLD